MSKKNNKILSECLLSKIVEIKKQIDHNCVSEIVYQQWSIMVGEKLSKHTCLIGFSNGVLSVRVLNSAAFFEICKTKKEVLLKLNSFAPDYQIKNIIFKVY